MAQEDDPLSELYVDESLYDRNRLTNVLNQFVGIDSDDGSMVKKPEFHDLDDQSKVICYLLYVRVSHELGEIEESDLHQLPNPIAQNVGLREVEANEIAEDLSIVDGGATEDGEFRIPPSKIDRAVALLESPN